MPGLRLTRQQARRLWRLDETAVTLQLECVAKLAQGGSCPRTAPPGARQKSTGDGHSSAPGGAAPASELILQPALRIWNVECGIRDRGCHAINWPEALTRIPNSKFLISFVPVSFSPPAYHPRGARAGHSSRTPG